MGERLEAAGVQVWAGKRSGEHLLLLLLPTAADVYRGLALLNLFIRLFEASIFDRHSDTQEPIKL